MIQSPTCANRPGSATSSSAAASRRAVAASNFRSAVPAQQRPFFGAALRDPLLAAFFDPLLGPFSNLFRQHRAHLLQPRQPPGLPTPETPRQQHLRHPRPERLRQLLVTLLAQQTDQRPQQLRQPLPITTRLQRDQRRHQIAARQIGIPDAALVQQKVPLRWLIPRQRRTARCDQFGYVRRRVPPPSAVVGDDRQHRPAARCSRSTPSPISFWYSRDVREHPDAPSRGPRWTGTPGAAPGTGTARGVEAHAPHQVAVGAATQVVADMAGRQWSQGGEVEGAAPLAGGEAVQQVLDHAWPARTTVCTLDHPWHNAAIISRPPIHPGSLTSRRRRGDGASACGAARRRH